MALDKCVNAFAEAIKTKLVHKYLEGRSGWDDPEWPREDILKQLRAHIDKGDMIDVAAFAMFAWNQGDFATTSKPCDNAQNSGTGQINIPLCGEQTMNRKP